MRTKHFLINGIDITAHEVLLMETEYALDSNKAVAAALGIKENTLNHELTLLYAKLGISGRTSLVKFYMLYKDTIKEAD